jgi:hypothetical protein
VGRYLLRREILSTAFRKTGILKRRSIEKTFADKRVTMKRNFKPAVFVICLLVFGFFKSLAWGQDGRIDFDVSYSVDWIRGELSSQVSFSLAQAGIRLPTGRFLGEDTLRKAYPGLLRASLLSLRLDSNSTIRDMVDRGEISLEEMDALSLEAGKIPPYLSPDLTRMAGSYTVFMRKIGALFTRQRRAIEPASPLIPVSAANYTGIIIIADGELPVHGRKTQTMMEPCLFPKIWDTEMTLIYERNMFDPGMKEERLMVRYSAPENIFRGTPSGLDRDMEALLGSNPLRIIAGGIFGINPTDPVIDREDALKILSSENNRRLLREGRVLLVLNEGKLK